MSLEAASQKHGIHPETVLRHIDGFVKKGGRWCARASVRSEVVMPVYTRGRVEFIHVPDTRQASLVGRYHNARKAFLETGDVSHMLPFVGKHIRSTDGRTYELETDPRELYEMAERRPEEEYFSIYRRG